MSNTFIDDDDIRFLHDVRQRTERKMKGIPGIINALMIALICRGHVLLEGNPGLGKTALIRALCDALGLVDTGTEGEDNFEKAVGRIQFTPDLMPSDITGTRLPDGNRELRFQKGPLFCKLLLADEINRATPKTQAAMLEAMAEFQVTVLGQRYALSHPLDLSLPSRGGGALRATVDTPFLVMATQNPVEQEGTYPLPEAQLDRFIFKVLMPFPARDILQMIVAKDVGGLPGPDADGTEEEPFDPDETMARLHRIGKALRANRPSQQVQEHILNVVLASIGDMTQLGQSGLSDRRIAELRDFHAAHIDYPLGPRAATSLTLATLGWAVVAEIEEGEGDQVASKSTESLAKVAVAVLRHRMKFKTVGFDFEDDTGSARAGPKLSQAEQHDSHIRDFLRLTAPEDAAYVAAFGAALDSAARTVPL